MAKERLGKYIQEYSVKNKKNLGYPVYSVTNSQGFCTQYFNKDVSGEDKTTYKIVPKGYFAYNPSRINVGSIDWQNCEDNVIVSPLYVVFKCTEGLNQNYLKYYLKSETGKRTINTKVSGSVRNNLKFEVLSDFMLNIGSVEEQLQIVDCLGKIDKAIAEERRQLVLYDELIKSRFVELFGALEKNTTISRYIYQLRGGKSLAGTKPCKNRVLKTGATTFGWFDAEQYKYLPNDYEPLPEHRVEIGDVIISRMNTPELVGACSYVFEAPDNMYYPDRLWKVVLKEKTNPIFLWQLLWDNEIRKSVMQKAGGTSGTMHNISKPNLLSIKCIDAPIELQNKFAEFVTQIYKAKKEIQYRLSFYEELLSKKTDELFNGESA